MVASTRSPARREPRRRRAPQLEPSVTIQIGGARDPAGKAASPEARQGPRLASSTRDPAGLEMTRSPAPLLSRSATSNRAVPGARPGSGSARARRAASKPDPSGRMDSRVTLPSAATPSTSMIPSPLTSAAAIAATRGNWPGTGRSTNPPPRRLRYTRSTPWSSRSAASGTPSPSRSAQTKPRTRDAVPKGDCAAKVPSLLLRSTTGAASRVARIRSRSPSVSISAGHTA